MIPFPRDILISFLFLHLKFYFGHYCALQQWHLHFSKLHFLLHDHRDDVYLPKMNFILCYRSNSSYNFVSGWFKLAINYQNTVLSNTYTNVSSLSPKIYILSRMFCLVTRYSKLMSVVSLFCFSSSSFCAESREVVAIKSRKRLYLRYKLVFVISK